jgi:hypothetical protein
LIDLLWQNLRRDAPELQAVPYKLFINRAGATCDEHVCGAREAVGKPGRTTNNHPFFHTVFGPALR